MTERLSAESVAPDKATTALAALWLWAVTQGIERHAADGDTIAEAIVTLVQSALIDGDEC